MIQRLKTWWNHRHDFKCQICREFKHTSDIDPWSKAFGLPRERRCRDCQNKIWRTEREQNRVILGKCNFCGDDVDGDLRHPDWNEDNRDPKGGWLHRGWCPGSPLSSKERDDIIAVREARARIDELCDIAWEKNRG